MVRCLAWEGAVALRQSDRLELLPSVLRLLRQLRAVVVFPGRTEH
jgi:hypothetical protein